MASNFGLIGYLVRRTTHSSENKVTMIFFIVDFVILIAAYFKTKPAKIITAFSCIGIITHFLLLFVCIPMESDHQIGVLGFIDVMLRGLIGNEMWIVLYILMIVILFNFQRVNAFLNRRKFNHLNIAIVFISIELIMSFFFFSVVKGLSFMYYGNMFYFNRLFVSPFRMAVPYANELGVPGSNEGSPYIFIMLICYVAFIVLAILKDRKAKLIGIILSTISFLILIIGAFDLFDSFMMNYITYEEPNFFNVFHLSFLVIIGLNILVIFFFAVEYKKDSFECDKSEMIITPIIDDNYDL